MCMVVVVTGCRKVLVGTGRAISLLCTSECRKHSFHLVGGSISGTIGSFQSGGVFMVGYNAIESLLMSGCG